MLEHEQIEIDYCASCFGVWLDRGELELLLNSSQDIKLNADITSGERPLKCPRCRKRMEKVRGHSEHGVILDRCKSGHGLWFDGGELEAFLKGEKIGPGNRISEHLRGIFVKKAKPFNTGEATC